MFDVILFYEQHKNYTNSKEWKAEKTLASKHDR